MKGPFNLIRFCMLRLKSNQSRICSKEIGEQTEQQFRRFESVLKKRVTVIVGLFY